jgi:hypothetical protein
MPVIGQLYAERLAQHRVRGGSSFLSNIGLLGIASVIPRYLIDVKKE